MEMLQILPESAFATMIKLCGIPSEAEAVEEVEMEFMEPD